MTEPATDYFAPPQQGDINAAQVLPGDRNHPQYPERGYHGTTWIGLNKRVGRLHRNAAEFAEVIDEAIDVFPEVAELWRPDRYDDALRLLHDARQVAELFTAAVGAARTHIFQCCPTEYKNHRAPHPASAEAAITGPHDDNPPGD